MPYHKFTKVCHGMRGSGAWRSWCYMKSRVLSVTNKDHKYYEGITMDPRWDSFLEFYRDMGDRPDGKTLDRIDNKKGYYLDNCRWATRTEQSRNTRLTAKHQGMIETIRGRIKDGECGLKIARELGVSRDVVYNIKNGRTWKEVAHV